MYNPILVCHVCIILNTKSNFLHTFNATEPHKPNQDDYHVTPTKFASGDGDAIFAVFDGHGANGHDCSYFAKLKFPSLLATNIKKARAAKNAARMKDNPQRAKEPGAFHPNQWPYLMVEEYERCCRDAALQCNKAMHQDNTVRITCDGIVRSSYTLHLFSQYIVQVGDTMSGTTAIAVSFHAGNMTVTNLGDSRAVLGYRIDSDIIQHCAAPQDEEKKEISDLFARDDEDCLINSDGKKLSVGDIVAVALSQDQTPYRKDERERLKNAGARICTIGQMEGKEPMHENWGQYELGVDINYEGDIPRVWCAEHNYPGTAFSRSLGDSVAEYIGVNADPEILTKKVTRGDEFLVIASDGIFEFLTNQDVIDICASSSDPAQACSRLLEASYAMWLEHETRTDDITCIVLFLKNTVPNDVEAMRKLICQKHQVILKNKMSREMSTTMLSTSKSLE